MKSGPRVIQLRVANCFDESLLKPSLDSVTYRIVKRCIVPTFFDEFCRPDLIDERRMGPAPLASRTFPCGQELQYNEYELSMNRRTLLTAIFLAHACLAQSDPCQKSELFQSTRIWNVHLSFSQEQWQALEPVKRLG